MLTANTGIRAGDIVINIYRDSIDANWRLANYPDVVVLDVTVLGDGRVTITSLRPHDAG